jgi:hypothetical protein
MAAAHRAKILLFAFAFASSLILSVFASKKLDDVTHPVGFNTASSIISKCLAPFSSVLFGQSNIQPICSAKEFSGYSAEELMKFDVKQIKSLPPSYFKYLKIEQAIPLSPTFINNLEKDQAIAFAKNVEDALPDKSRKLLQKIKRRPGPIARAIIMTLSALIAYLVFKYS